MKKIVRLTESDLRKIVSEVKKKSERFERVEKDKLTEIINILEEHLSTINIDGLTAEQFYLEDSDLFPFEWFISRLKRFTTHLAEDIYEFQNDNYDWMKDLTKEEMVRDILINSLLWFFYLYTGKEYDGEHFYGRNAPLEEWYDLVLELYGEVIGDFYDDMTLK